MTSRGHILVQNTVWIKFGKNMFSSLKMQELGTEVPIHMQIFRGFMTV